MTRIVRRRHTLPRLEWRVPHRRKFWHDPVLDVWFTEAAVRQWAQGRGLEVADAGRLPYRLVAEYAVQMRRGLAGGSRTPAPGPAPRRGQTFTARDVRDWAQARGMPVGGYSG